MNLFSRSMTLGAAALAVLATSGAPAFAQDGDEDRIRKLEAEVRALQRKVFPGGDGRYFEPQISPAQQPGVTTTVAAPSTTAVTDILVRLDALENSIQRLTAQTEENSNQVRDLTSRVEILEQVRAAPIPAPAISASQGNLDAMTGGASAASSAPPTAQPAAPDPARLAAVQEIAKPQTDDPADDEYVYGFRLWDAGFFPEAQQQLTMFVERYPDHWRTTYGRNLLGRAYLDAGNARDAAPWFLRNYQADKQAARAPDSLLYLAESMIALNDTERACIALAEFADTYTAIASGRLADEYRANLAKVDCD